MNDYELSELERRAEAARKEIELHDKPFRELKFNPQPNDRSYLLLVMLVGAIIVAELLMWGPR